MSDISSIYPNAHYRVSAKAFIRDSDGEILVVQEKNGRWSLPGGGIDFGEVPIECLKRELSEELSITDEFSAELVGIDTYYHEARNKWLMWILYEIQFADGYTYVPTDEINGATFVDCNYFESGELPYQQLIHKWTKKLR